MTGSTVPPFWAFGGGGSDGDGDGFRGGSGGGGEGGSTGSMNVTPRFVSSEVRSGVEAKASSEVKSDAAICFSIVEPSEEEDATGRFFVLREDIIPHHVVHAPKIPRFCQRRMPRVMNVDAAGLTGIRQGQVK